MTALEFTVLFLCSAAFGAILGAYFGTVEYRVQSRKPLITGRCFCPECGHFLPLLHQIPVLSWIFLKGRCRFCGAPISIRYPLIEGGFFLYYAATFLLFWKSLPLLLFSWFFPIIPLLFFRCRKNIFGAAKALLIFAGYHALYGLLLTVIYAALGLI